MKPAEPPGNDKRRRQLAVQMTALGLEFSGAVIGGLAVGYYLDEWLGTEPWFMLLGTFGGLATAVVRLVTLTKRFQQIRDEQQQR
ncbi:MAG TPA: AtpZ/AtpI family protein [Candidatus Binatia bacterium]